MFFFVFAGEQRISDVELVQDASETPHIDRGVVWNTQHDLRCAVESRLDVRVYLLVFKAPRPKVDDLNSRFVDLSQQNVFGFQITMHDVVFPHVVQRDKNLDSEALN